MLARRLLLQFLSILLLVCWANCCKKLEKQWLIEEMVKEYHVGPSMAANMYPHVLKDKDYSEVRKNIWDLLVTFKKEIWPKQREIDAWKIHADRDRERMYDNKEREVVLEILHHEMAKVAGTFYPETHVKFLHREVKRLSYIRRRDRQEQLELKRQHELVRIRESEDLP